MLTRTMPEPPQEENRNNQIRSDDHAVNLVVESHVKQAIVDDHLLLWICDAFIGLRHDSDEEVEHANDIIDIWWLRVLLGVLTRIGDLQAEWRLNKSQIKTMSISPKLSECI